MRGASPTTRLAHLFTILFICSGLIACGSEDPVGDSSNNIIESTVGTTSHNFGQSCIEPACHGPTATGSQPHFRVAGSVYPMPTNTANSFNGAVEIVYVGSNNLVKSIPVNNSGNFYTTDGSIKLDATMTARIRNTSSNAVTNPMSAIAVGGCNGCHDSNLKLNRP